MPTASFAGQAGGTLVATTFSIERSDAVLQTGATLTHVVTVKGQALAWTGQAGGTLRASTVKNVPSDSLPGGLMLLGVGG